MRILIAAASVAAFATPTLANPAEAAARERLAAAVRASAAERFSYAPLPEGVSRTSVARRGDGWSSEAGFICGREDIAERGGSAGAYGSDAHGRFVGAAVKLSFR